MNCSVLVPVSFHCIYREFSILFILAAQFFMAKEEYMAVEANQLSRRDRDSTSPTGGLAIIRRPSHLLKDLPHRKPCSVGLLKGYKLLKQPW